MVSVDNIRKQVEGAASDAGATARDELEALKKQLEHFLNTHVVPPISDAASSAVSNARELADQQKKTVALNVGAKPFLSVALSSSVGIVLGRACR